VTLCVGSSYGQKSGVPSELMKYLSPDGSLVAIITSFHEREATAESKVELRLASGKLVAQRSYSSDDGEHGYGVAKAQWTPDSRYFVFSLESSGGHQPWHAPVQYFSRKSDSFLSLDDALDNAVTNPEFVIEAPYKVTVDLYFGNKTATASLSTLKAAR
jgi:dipeptidyl aminopeptidase/acylaminoacyl peptidase